MIWHQDKGTVPFTTKGIEVCRIGGQYGGKPLQHFCSLVIRASARISSES